MNQKNHPARFFGLFSIVVLLALGGCKSTVSDADVRTVTLGDVQRATARTPNVVFVDPRSPEAFAAGRIPGAINVQLPEVTSDARRLEPLFSGARHIFVYADNPGSGVGPAMAKRLISAGYRRVELFAGGLSAWRAAGLPLESGE